MAAGAGPPRRASATEGLAAKRADQRLDFTWALVRDELEQRLRRSPAVAAIRADVRAGGALGRAAAHGRRRPHPGGVRRNSRQLDEGGRSSLGLTGPSTMSSFGARPDRRRGRGAPDELIELRRDLHAHPELSWHEERTTEVVAERLERAGLARHPAARTRADRRRRRRRAAWSRCAPTSTRCRSRTAPTDAVGQHPPGRRPRLRARRAHRRPGRRRARARRGPPAGELPGRVRLLFQPAEEVMPGGALDLIEPRRPRRGRAGSSACTATPASTSGRSACARARSPAPPTDRGPAHRQGRPHLAPAPDRGPHLRPRQAGHRAARRALAPPRPPRGRQRGLGHGPRRRRRPTSSRPPASSAARCGCSTRSPGLDAERLVRD